MQGTFDVNVQNISVVAVTYCHPLELERGMEALSRQSPALREVVVSDHGAAMSGDARQVCPTASTTGR